MGQAFAGTLIPYSINISCLTFVLLNCDESVMKIGTGGGGGGLAEYWDYDSFIYIMWSGCEVYILERIIDSMNDRDNVQSFLPQCLFFIVARHSLT